MTTRASRAARDAREAGASRRWRRQGERTRSSGRAGRAVSGACDGGARDANEMFRAGASTLLQRLGEQYYLKPIGSLSGVGRSATS